MFVNMFWFDRALRSAVGTIMLGAALFHQELLLYLVGGTLVATGLTGFCPLHALAHFHEPKADDAGSKQLGAA